MKNRVRQAILVLAATTFAAPSWAASLMQVGTIAVPGQKLTSFDISFVDQASGLYYTQAKKV